MISGKGENDMLEKIKKFLGIAATTDYKRLVDEGAKIIDVRTPAEYSSGHIPESINIPLSLLSKKVGKIGKNKQIILCCASGMRSNSAKVVLLSLGYLHVHDGGSWNRLLAKIQ
jgi:phage shock protein E